MNLGISDREHSNINQKTKTPTPNFGNFGIRSRLFASFGTLIARMAGVGFVGWQSASHFAGDARGLHNDELEGAVDLANTETGLWRLRYGSSQYLAVPSLRQQIIDETPKWTKQVNDNAQAYSATNLTADEQKLYNDFQHSFSKYTTARKQWLGLEQAGKIQEAAAFREAVQSPAARSAVDALEKLIAIQRQSGEAKYKNILENERNFIILLLSLILLAIALSVLLTIIVSRGVTGSVLKSVSQITSSSSKIASTVNQQEQIVAEQADSVSQTTTTIEELGTISLQSAQQALEKHPSDPVTLEQFLREAHTLKGDSRMLGVQEVETLIHQIEEIVGTVKSGEAILTRDLCDCLYQGLDAISKLVHEAVTGEAADVNVFFTLAQLMGAVTELDREAQSSQMDDFLADTPDEASRLDDSLLPGLVSETAQIPTEQLEEPLLPATAQASSYQIDTIRVEPKRLDALMMQASELTFTKQRMAQLMIEIEEIISLWEDWSREALGSRPVMENLKRFVDNDNLQPLYHFHQSAEQRLERLGVLMNQLKSTVSEDNSSLDIVANQLESGIKSLRLLPLSNLFNLFPRMVRDLAKQQGKAVDLVIEGGDTLADKRILEEMRDPLLHLMRNAIDHGIETPPEREILGKPRTATIRLRGKQTGNRIAIEIVDDGRGLNIESIKRTVRQKGIYSEQELAQMTTAQIHSLIFMPGFSTRTTVTELFGRGVGLDVVRANVERLKGTIEINSAPGMGCQVHIQLSTT